MKTYKYITLAALALGFAACTQDDNLSPQQEDIVKIASANIATEVQTRVNTLADGTQWENTDQILLVNNSRDDKNSGTYTYDGTNWELSEGVVLYASTGTNNFTAYYPASVDFTLPTDQSDEAKIKSADRMVATATGIAKGDAVALSFERENAMVTITPSFNTEFGSGATISSLQIAGITPYHPADAEDYKAVIAPATTGFTVTLIVGEQPLTATTSTQIEAGKHYTFNLTVGKDKAEISSVSVADWADGGTLEGGEAEECTHENVVNGICNNCGLEINSVYDKTTNTYTVYTEAGLQEWYLAAQSDLTTNLTLAADISLSATTADGTAITVDENGMPSGSNWTPIGTDYNHQFTGTINGGGHTLSGLRISSTTSDTGFIGNLGTGGAVKNLTLANAVVHSTQYCIGTVVGSNGGTMENCHVADGSSVATSDSNSQAGGIVGNNRGLLMGCTHAAAVKGTDSFGGIAGLNGYGGSIIACANTGTVDGTFNLVEGAGSTYACWSTASNDLYSNYGYYSSRTACYIITNNGGSPTVSVPADEPYEAPATIADAITAMNAAIVAYNANEENAVKCPYTWQLGTDGYPTLVKSE